MAEPETILTGTYSPFLVLLSVLVAVMSAYCAFMLARRVGYSEYRPFSVRGIASAAAMGTGIWSMHFIAMMAFKLPIPVSYNLAFTMASLLLPIVMLWLVLYVFNQVTVSRLTLLSTAVLTGLGIAAMHYTGMAAMQMPAKISYSPSLVVVSIAIAIFASLYALSTAFRFRHVQSKAVYSRMAVSALLLGGAICGMHYTAMAASTFVAVPQETGSSLRALDPSQLAVAIGIAIILILSTVVFIAGWQPQKGLSIRTKVGLLTIALVIVTAGTIGTTSYLYNKRLQLERELVALTDEVHTEATQLKSTVHTLIQDALFLAQIPEIQGIIRAQAAQGDDPLDGSSVTEWQNRLAEIFSKFLEAKPEYLQLRFIGARDRGREIVRVHRTDNRIVRVPEQNLQYKHNAPYYQATLALNPGKVYLSDINLNREHGVVAQPHVPVLRAATPIQGSDGRFAGIVIINMNFQPILDELIKSRRQGDIGFVTNDAGDYLAHNDESKTFGFDLGTRHRIQDMFPQIRSLFEKGNTTQHGSLRVETDTGELGVHYEKVAFDPQNAERFILVAEAEPYRNVLSRAAEVLNPLILLTFILIAIAIVIAIIFSSIITRPLQQVTLATTQFTAGQQDIDLPDSSSDEVGLLSRAFRSMIDTVRERTNALVRSEETVRKILDNTADGILVVDHRGLIYSFNPAAQRIFGYSADEVIGQNVSLLIPEHYRNQHDDYIQQYHETGQTWIMAKMRELTGRRKDGSEFPLEIAITEQTMGEEKSFIGTVRDISQRKQWEEALRESEEKFRALSEKSLVGVYLVQNGEFKHVNPRFAEIFGYQVKEIYQGVTLKELVHPEDWPTVKENVRKRINGEVPSLNYMFRGMTKGGEVRDIEVYGSETNYQGKPAIIGTLLDITERKQVEAELRLAARFMESSKEGIIFTDTKPAILKVNQAFTKISGYSEEEAIGRNPNFMSSMRHDEEFFSAVWKTIRDKGSWEGEVWDRKKDGTIFPKWLSISAIRDEQGKVTNYVGLFSDITERKKSEERLEYFAHYDPLTKLPNRLLFQDRLRQSIEYASRNNRQFALLFLDLDRFKVINDTYGHETGDMLLHEVAIRLNRCIRDEDSLARLSGDEFTIILNDIHDAHGVNIVAEKISNEIEKPFKIKGHELFIGTSIGISMFPKDGEEPQTLAKHADIAMYRAKESGRNLCVQYEQSMGQTISNMLILENNLRHALEREELSVHYQPQLDLDTGNIIGMEALARWTHPELGSVPPDEFIPVAESTGLIISIGEWVLQEACSRNMSWQKAGLSPFRVAVNVSGSQLAKPNFHQVVERVLEKTGMAPKWLELEITETILMDYRAEAMPVLNKLNAMGIRLVVDDFGTGYSSLGHVKNLPIQVLKIDRSFVQDLPDDNDDIEIVRAIMALAHNLRLKVVAEGIENQQQLDFLKEQGCDLAQGYHISRPIPCDAVSKFLNDFQVH